MNIRIKLFIPTFVLMALLYVVIYFYWLPTNQTIEKKIYLDGEFISMELLGTALVPSILTNDIAQVHITLNKVLRERPHWEKIELFNKEAMRLYPVYDASEGDEESLKKIDYQIKNDGQTIATIKAKINIDKLIQRDTNKIKNLASMLLIIIFILSVSSALLQERWIRTPLKKLLIFSNNLSRGRYKESLRYESEDEFGELVDSFDIMRTEIQAREKKLQKAYIELAKINKTLEILSNTDALTDVSNRRYFDEILANEMSRSARQHSPIALIMCDIDFFKQYNDNYGHHMGDECLAKVAQALKNTVTRKEDIVARYGGEEFAVILPHTTIEQAMNMAEAMFKNVRELKIKHEHSEASEFLTVSIGVTAGVQDKNTTMGDLINKADKALYQAKNAGRNTIKVI